MLSRQPRKNKQIQGHLRRSATGGHDPNGAAVRTSWVLESRPFASEA